MNTDLITQNRRLEGEFNALAKPIKRAIRHLDCLQSLAKANDCREIAVFMHAKGKTDAEIRARFPQYNL